MRNDRVFFDEDGRPCYRGRDSAEVREAAEVERRRAVALAAIRADRDRRGLHPKHVPSWEIDGWLEENPL